MDDTVLVGFAKIIGISLVPVALLRRRTARPGRSSSGAPPGVAACTCSSTPLPVPTGPPLEKLAADLRRLRPMARSPKPGGADGPAARHRRGVRQRARWTRPGRSRCRPHLTELPEGIDREAERLRLEHALELAGSQLARARRPPSRRPQGDVLVVAIPIPSRTMAAKPRIPITRNDRADDPQDAADVDDLAAAEPALRLVDLTQRPGAHRPRDRPQHLAQHQPQDPEDQDRGRPRMVRCAVRRRRWWRGAHLASVSSDPGSDGRRR